MPASMPPSTKPAQYDLFELAYDRTDDGTVIMPPPATAEASVLSMGAPFVLAPPAATPVPATVPGLVAAIPDASVLPAHDTSSTLRTTAAGRWVTLAVLLAVIAILALAIFALLR
jgi:hypothetical protein